MRLCYARHAKQHLPLFSLSLSPVHKPQKGQENWQQGFANVPAQLGMTVHHCKEDVRKKRYIEHDVANYIGNAVSRGSTQKAKHQQALTGAH